MSARFDVGATKIDTGWIGHYQLPNCPQRFYVCEAGDRVVFLTQREAKDAAQGRFIAALNRSLIGGIITVGTVHKPAARAAAERLFRHGKVIPVERVRAGA